MNTEITTTQKKFNDVAKQRHLNMENLVLTALSLCDVKANKQPLAGKEKNTNKIPKRAIKKKT